jgi:transcriptional regulator with XRE-family HTH domain
MEIALKRRSPMISTGITYLDKQSGGLRLGDNVVWQVSNAVPVEYFIKAFFSGTPDFDKTIIYLSFNVSAQALCRKYHDLFTHQKAILIDAFAHGKGKSDPIFLDFYTREIPYREFKVHCLDNPNDIASFRDLLNEVQSEHREGCFYLFDSLTGMKELWKEESTVLDFFSFTCPKLYELNTLAYWICERESHTTPFLAGLTHITQVVFSVSKSSAEFFELQIHKLEGRPSFNLSPHPFRILDDRIHFQERRFEDVFKIGAKVKALRKIANITQAELAASLGMTPGAVSQIENAVITPSLQTLVQLSSLFNRSLNYFIDIDGSEKRTARGGYTIYRKENIHAVNRDIQITKLIEENAIPAQPFSVTIGGKKSHNGPLILHKGSEYIIVVKGSITVSIEGEEHTIYKGDSLLLSDSFVNKWNNRSNAECELIYFLF